MHEFATDLIFVCNVIFDAILDAILDDIQFCGGLC